MPYRDRVSMKTLDTVPCPRRAVTVHRLFDQGTDVLKIMNNLDYFATLCTFQGFQRDRSVRRHGV